MPHPATVSIRAGLRVALVATGLAVVGVHAPAPGNAGPLLAQEPAEHAAEHVDGFAGFPWGTPYDSLVAALGAPARDERLREGIRVLVYRDSSDIRGALELFAILDSIGLVKGQRTIPFGADEDCTALYIRIRDRISLHFPLLMPRETSRNDTGGDFCAAVAAGSAGWFTRWADEDTGARVTVLIEPGQRRIDVIYESRAFLDWVAALDAEAEADSAG